MKTTNEQKQTKLWKEIYEIRWQMKAYPNVKMLMNSHLLCKKIDQLLDLHDREINPKKYKL